MRAIDLNADLGETVDGVPTSDDEALFAVVSSANVACGGHAGDAASMASAVERASRFGVAIGAHPSYPDRAGFGRRAMVLGRQELRATLREQLEALRAAGADLRYVKPHGALYHAVMIDREQAIALVSAVRDVSDTLGRPLGILGMPGVVQREAERAGLPFSLEAFLDRAYGPDGALVARTEPGAVLIDPDDAAARAIGLVRTGRVRTIDGADIAVPAVSLCVHGDSPAAVVMAQRVRAALRAADVEVRAPW